MKKLSILTSLLLLTGFAFAQTYYNEWIDYSKTYYKFKIVNTGLYRINASDLAAKGLANEPAENFQLWRNGKQVAIYTTNATGPLAATGYIEFWGEKNDGVNDKDVYRDPNYQLSDKLSLFSDTAAYFLTAAAGINPRLNLVANNVSGNTLPPEPYFIHSARFNYKDRIHKGRAQVITGEYVYSSAYDMGEFWSSNDITPAQSLTYTFNNLFPAATGPAATFRIGMAGSAPNGSPSPGRQRRYGVDLNNTRIIDTFLNYFDAGINYDNSVPLSTVGNSASVTIRDLMAPDTFAFDRIVCSFIELNYPRQFNFGNSSDFTFSLSASATNRYLEINNFNAGSSAPVLFDLTNQRRYVADMSGSTARFVILPSANTTDFVLVSQSAANIIPAGNLQQRVFTDYLLSANQGNYLIITHPLLQGGGTDQVEQYKFYRSSAAGGSYNAKVYDINELTDQFAYGIYMNPLSIKHFLKYARNKFASAPLYTFLIGKGITYNDFRENEYHPMAARINLVPTWGYPASDNMMASDNMEPGMPVLTGRLSVVTPQEVGDYLDKVRQYEQAQQSTVQTIEQKAWMKNVVHVVGSNDPSIGSTIEYYMSNYKRIIEDTLYGGRVFTFSKKEVGPVTPIVNALMNSLFEQGIGLLTYFGHSSASSLDYNLDDPSVYNNTGKYPMFLVSGCNAGNLYSFDTSRFSVMSTLSEKFVLAKNKGAIGFIASTHFGIDNYLNFYNENFYKSVATTGYGKGVAYNMNESMDAIRRVYGSQYLARLHSEETALHGDPALKMNSFAKPDYIIEEPQVQIIPNILSLKDTKFTVKVKIYNVGKATGDSVRLQIKRTYFTGGDTLIFNSKIKAVRNTDSVIIDVPITGLRDKGENRITAFIDADYQWDELSETNNGASKIFTIYEDELTPVYPANYAIINKATVKLEASTANPIIPLREYLMEMDTTELFNSSFKITRSVISTGGLIEFDPGITFTDSTVYYWRVAPSVAGALRWNTSSFVYLNGSSTGYNQSHFYQHTKSATTDIYIDSASRRWKFSNKAHSLTIVNSVFGISGNEDNQFSVAIDGNIDIASACLGHSVIFNVFDPVSLKPFFNQPQPSTVKSGTGGGFMGSAAVVCAPTRQYNFEFSYLDTTGRRKMRDFMDWIPAGYYVTARLILDPPYDSILVNAWKNDEVIYGQNNSAYSRLKAAGFTDFDNYTYPRTWAFVYRKNVSSFTPISGMSNGLSDRLTLTTSIDAPGMQGYITSPAFGPAKAWKDVKWRGFSIESNPKDVYYVHVIGIKPNGGVDTLYTLQPNQQDFNISSVDPLQYPYLKLGMYNSETDSTALTPYQLRYWRILYDPLPEGAIAPNLTAALKDTFETGEPVILRIPFKNVSDAVFRDSIKVKFIVTKGGRPDTIFVASKKALQPGDTAMLSYSIDTKSLTDLNTIYIGFNANLEQPEQYKFNNFLYKNFYIQNDVYQPLMDVTFDGVHILNNDIVSAKPKIVVKLKDESKFLALDDTSLASVYVRYPGINGRMQRYAFGTDTLKLIPANVATGKNEATIEFTPAFTDQSETEENTYTLIIKGKDKSGNPAGNTEYKVNFQVISKPMISDMFNYPNPFTTSTAFVFTLTGSEVPQMLRIQILTITGKIVKEITRQELGPLHIGRNITEYKWDGTDQFGSKLGNGVYLYRVITSLNGNSLEKYNIKNAGGEAVNTDKYFNKGYGKMYLMR